MKAIGLLPVILAGGLLGVAAPQQPAPQPPQTPVFRAGLVTVAVPVTVFDSEGEIVTTLKREDFKVFDDQRRQEITNFVSGLQPITIVVLIDTSASMTVGLSLARTGAEQLIIRMRPGDKAQIGTFSNHIEFSGEFVENRDQLLTFTRDLPFGNPTRLFDAIDQAITALQTQQGRRVIVPFTDGCDTDSATRWDLVRARLIAEDLMIYPVQVRSRVVYPLINGRNGGRGMTDCQRQIDLELLPSASLRDIIKDNDPRRNLWGAQVIQQLGGDTGGGLVTLATYENINAVFTRLMNELHYSYLLGFTPEKFDGKVHNLQVRVPDRTMSVRARRNYQSPLPK